MRKSRKPKVAGILNRRVFLWLQAITGLGFFAGYRFGDREPTGEVAASPTRRALAPTSPALPPPVSMDDLLLFREGDERYDKLSARFNLRVKRRPGVIVLCRDAADISTAVRYAQQEGLAVSVKSGGHSFESFSSNDGGLVVDLSLLNEVEWIDDETIRVGPGCKLSELYSALLPRRRLLPAGACGGVGVGGLTLGGGYGFFSRELGLTCDSLTELSLVDGTGTPRNTSQDPELLWACRGGGNGNFGVVSEMIFKTSPAPSGLYRHRFRTKGLTPTRAAQLMEIWFRVAADLPTTAYSSFVLNKTSLLILVTDTRPRGPATEPALRELASVMKSASYGRHEDLAAVIPKHYGHPGPLYFKNASAGMYTDFGDIRAVAGEVTRLVGDNPLILQINTLGGNVMRPELERASAFPHRSRPFLAELQTYYDKPSQGAARLRAFRQVQATLNRNGVRHHYRNYPDLDLQDWESAYYGDSYPRLQRVKGRYDPHDLFRHPQSIRLS